MNMNKKQILLIVLALTAAVAGIFCSRVSQKENSVDPEEYLEHIVNAAEDVLDGDIQQISKTELVATLVYGHDAESDNSIYYRVLQTTYGEVGNPNIITGVNTDALNTLFPVDMMDSCEEMIIQDWFAALYKKDDTAYLCWTCNPEVTYVLEYTPSKLSDAEIIKMANSAKPIAE
jgi:hypothetical protein